MSIAPDLQGELKQLRELGYELEGPVDGPGETLVVFPKFPVPEGRYNMSSPRLLIRVPAGYPNAAIDMFYTQPDFLLASGNPPRQADVLESLAGSLWRRFSWHRNVPWIPGRDSLLSFVSFVEDNLARGL